MATKTLKFSPTLLEIPEHVYKTASHCEMCANKYFGKLPMDEHAFVNNHHCVPCNTYWNNQPLHDFVNQDHCGACFKYFRAKAEAEYLEEMRRIETERRRKRAELDARRCKECGALNICVHRVRTQKARGVMALRDAHQSTPTVAVIQSESDISVQWDSLSTANLFARPCPVRPRHGFVDSSRVKTIEQARDVFLKAQAADPESEMLLMPFMNAVWSAVWTPGRIAIGPGHDGATSGRDSFTIPLLPPAGPSKKWWETISTNAGIVLPDQPFIEAVLTDHKQYGERYRYWLTQIRGGPPIPATAGVDYIPQVTQVTEVVKAEGDLLEWETKAAQFTPGTVVWHPGGSMASHYAIHCLLNSVPIVITYEPHVGDTLQPTQGANKVINMQSVVRGIGAATAFDLTRPKYGASVAALLIGLHNIAAFSDDDGFWVGAACALMQRLGGVALLGEARHATYREGTDREEIYDTRIQTPFQTRRRLHRALWMFQYYPWRGSYGGEAWANCGVALFKLDEAIRTFVQQPRKALYTTLGAALNEAVNQAHNGGWWLNKFTDGAVMDQAVQNDPRPAIAAIGVLAELRNVEASEIEKMVNFWQVARPIPLPAAPEKVAKPKAKEKVQHKKADPYSIYLNALSDKEIPVTAVKPQPAVKEKEKGKVVSAQAKIEYGVIHIQYKTDTHVGDHYNTHDISLDAVPKVQNCHKTLEECVKSGSPAKSLAVTATPYFHLMVVPGNIIGTKCGNFLTAL